MSALRGRRAQVLAVLCVVVVLGTLLVVGLERRRSGDSDPVARPLSPEAADLLTKNGTVDPDVRVVAGDELHDRIVRFTGSGHTVDARGSEPVRLPALRDVARLVLGHDATGAVTAAAIQVPLTGYPSEPLAVDYTETAFARLVTIPPYATDDPRELIILRGFADTSPHLAGLAREMLAHARDDPETFWTSATAGEQEELAALAADVGAGLRDIVPQLRPAAFHGGPSSDFAVFPEPVPYHDCVPSDVAPGWPGQPMTENTTTGVCLFPVRQEQDGSYEIGAVNYGPSWAFVYSAQPGGWGDIPVAAVRPHTAQWPSLQQLVIALGQDIATAVPRVLLDHVCSGLRWLSGTRCTEDLTVGELDQLFSSLGDRLGDISSHGVVTFPLDAEAARHPLGVSTGGLLPVEAPAPAGVPPDRLVGVSDLAFLCSVASQIIAPAMSLISGTRLPLVSAFNGRRPEGEPGRHHSPSATPQMPDPDALPGRHRGDINYARELWSPLLHSYADLRSKGEVEKALADLRSLNPTQMLPGAAGFVTQLIASPGFLTAVIALMFPQALDWFTAALAEVARTLAFVAVPGIGWIRALLEGSERAIPGAGFLYGAWRFARDLPLIVNAHWGGPVAPPPTAPPPPLPPPPADVDPPTPPREWSEVVQLDCSSAIEGPLVRVVAETDITGDQVPETFLVSECEASTSSWPQVLSIYGGATGSTNPSRLQTLLDYEDGVDFRGLRDIHILELVDDALTVGAVAYADLDGNCCPSLAVVDYFVWAGSQYEHVSRDVTPI